MRGNNPGDPIQFIPYATLASGVVVGNFSSPHPFSFTDGTTLPACSDDRARWYMLNAIEVESPGIKGTTDIELTFKLTDEMRQELERAQMFPIDIIVVPLPVMMAMVEAEMDIGRCRSIRMADRITKTVYADRWCKS